MLRQNIRFGTVALLTADVKFLQMAPICVESPIRRPLLAVEPFRAHH